MKTLMIVYFIITSIIIFISCIFCEKEKAGFLGLGLLIWILWFPVVTHLINLC